MIYSDILFFRDGDGVIIHRKVHSILGVIEGVGGFASAVFLGLGLIAHFYNNRQLELKLMRRLYLKEMELRVED